MSGYTFTYTELLYASSAAGLTLATFTTEAQANTTGTMGNQASIPANFFNQNTSVGKTIKIVARGILASTATPTYTFTVRGGAAANITTAPILGGTAAMATVSGATTCAWEYEVDCVFKTLGAGPSGTGNSTLVCVGRVFCAGLATTANNMVYGAAASPGTVATFDPKIENYINFNIACSASSASNTISLQQLLVFGLN